ncbi:MAG: hypothetical protein RL108_337 [Bacteroidota bacterium]
MGLYNILEMKNIITTLLFLVLFTNCKAQVLEQTIVPIEDLKGSSYDGTYYKDIHNLLNPFVGTWLYSNGTTSLKLVLRKIIGFDSGRIKEDLIVGEYEYIENGFTKINTLQNINTDTPGIIDHSVNGNTFVYSFVYPKCYDCSANELRLRLSLHDPLKEVGFSVFARKIMVNGQNALSIYMYSDGIKYTGATIEDYNTESVGATMPSGTFVFMKHP